MPEIVHRLNLPVSAAEAFAWHERPGAFARLSPPWMNVAVEEHQGGIRDGATVTLLIRQGPLKMRWTLQHSHYKPGEQFRDEQVNGPFANWRHDHLFKPKGQGGSSVLEDRITFSLPRVLGGVRAKMIRDLQRLFRYRHAVTHADLSLIAANPEQPKLRIFVTGATGLVGSALCAFLQTQGHEVVRQSRRPLEGGLQWAPGSGVPDLSPLEPLDAVVHLAGAPIARRWDEQAKREIRESRERGTRQLAEAVAKLSSRPVFVSASGINYYGSQPEGSVDEDSPVGNDFLAEVSQAWEAAAEPARQAGLRVVHPRIGTVLSPKGGAVAKLLPVFLAGGGGPIGKGSRVMPWIALDDLIYLLYFLIQNEEIEGPINAVAPEVTTNKAFTKALSRSVRRPALIPVLPQALKLAFGQMAEETILADLTAAPQKLLSSGFTFRYPDVESAFKHLFGR